MGRNNTTLTKYQITFDKESFTVHFFAGSIVDAPKHYLNFLRGKSLYAARAWVAGKGGTVERIENTDT